MVLAKTSIARPTWFSRLIVELCVAAMGLVFSANLAAQVREDELVVSTSALRCLTENITRYIALEKDPVVVFMDLCPDPNPAREKILSISTNSLPDVKTESAVEAGPSAARIVVLSKRELVCLKRISEDGTIAASVRAIPGKPELSRLDLRACVATRSAPSN